MMSAEARHQLDMEQSAKAANRNKHPAVLFAQETIPDDLRKAPWLGSYLHKNWEHLTFDEYKDVLFERSSVFTQEDDDWVWLFVDKSGWGGENEPALSHDQLCRLLSDVMMKAEPEGTTIGVGIVDEGQFQCHLGLYIRR